MLSSRRIQEKYLYRNNYIQETVFGLLFFFFYNPQLVEAR